MDKFFNNWLRRVSGLFLLIMNIVLFFIGIALAFSLFHQGWGIGALLFKNWSSDSFYDKFIEELILFFLYFEFLALIMKYFKHNFHFPLRYFLYIGITAIIRLIIVDHDSAGQTLMWSGAILILVISLAITNKYIKHD